MTWIRENKFLATLFGFLFVGAAVLGFLLFTAYSTYSGVSETYNAQATELLRLQNLQPYPDAENLEKLEAQKQMHTEVVDTVVRELATVEIPVEPLTPEGFQDRLRTSVSAIVSRARESNPKVELPDKFYMGFEPYQTGPPSSAAAPLLGRQLKAMELVMNIVIDAKVDKVTSLRRTITLPEEGGAGAGTAAAGSSSSSAGAGSKAPVKKASGKDARSLVAKLPFDLTFVADQGEFRLVLDNIVGSKSQFFIVRNLLVRNQNDKGPPRVDPNVNISSPIPDPTTGVNTPSTTSPAAEPAGEAAVPEAGGGKATGGPALTFIVGTEKVETAMRIEIVDFADPDLKVPAKVTAQE